jgi:hypothetical protein
LHAALHEDVSCYAGADAAAAAAVGGPGLKACGCRPRRRQRAGCCFIGWSAGAAAAGLLRQVAPAHWLWALAAGAPWRWASLPTTHSPARIKTEEMVHQMRGFVDFYYTFELQSNRMLIDLALRPRRIHCPTLAPRQPARTASHAQVRSTRTRAWTLPHRSNTLSNMRGSRQALGRRHARPAIPLARRPSRRTAALVLNKMFVPSDR